MEKILVTTDLSTNSKAGIRYALQLAKSRNAELIILNVYHVLRASAWSDQKYRHYAIQIKENLVNDLASFVKSVYKSSEIEDVGYECVLQNNLDTVEGITQYAVKHKCDYICISTHGAGMLNKMFGTNTSRLITKSTIPVLSVPSNYRMKPLENIVYATDMTDYERELKQVVAFANPVKANVEMLHFYDEEGFQVEKKLMEESLKKTANYEVSIQYIKRNVENSLLQDLDNVIKMSKPSLLVMFTNHSRSFFERIFLSSTAEAYSFYGKIPLLTFNKIILQVKEASAKSYHLQNS